MLFRSGNDITFEKLRDLKEYVDAGYPILFADGFFVNNNGVLSVNTAKIDANSNMYQLAKYALEAKIGSQNMFGENINIWGNIEKDTAGTGAKSKLTKYLNISKLVIQYEKNNIPVEYNGNANNKQYLTPDNNGNYVLEYEFSLKNDAAVGVADSTYDCKLYIDSSVDGRFSKAEELDALSVYEKQGNDYTAVGMQDGKYQLRVGKTYKVTRIVPIGYNGVLPWKLVFLQNNRVNANSESLVRKSIRGYTALPARTEKPTINVIQIMTGSNNSGGTLDLWSIDMQA